MIAFTDGSLPVQAATLAWPGLVNTTIAPVAGRLPETMVPDPVSYFVIFIDRVRRQLNLEH